MEPDGHRIVVIGGGYVGAVAAARAAGRAGRRAQVTLIDPEGSLVQRLRLHQVATGQRVVAPELRKLCGRRVEQLLGRAELIDPERGRVHVRRQGDASTRVIPYDSLIVATGSTVDTTTVPGVAEHAHSLSDLGSSLRLARELERAPEGARILVIGGGLTGIEAASEIADARPDAEVAIVGSESFGGWLSPAGRSHLRGAFDRLGIDVLDGVRVDGVGIGAIEPATGSSLPFDLAVWCGGFVPRSLASESGLAVGPRGGMLVDRRMRSLSHPEVLAAGDAAECPHLTNGASIRMTCQAGIPAGAHAADVVVASIRGRAEEDFDFGYVAQSVSLGRRDGLIQWLDRADRPRDHVTCGRRAARLKQMVTTGGAKAAGWERRIPGVNRWLASGAAPEAAADREPEPEGLRRAAR